MSKHLAADTYIPANPATGERARLVATIESDGERWTRENAQIEKEKARTSHAANCVCSSCLARRPTLTKLEGALRAERGRSDSIQRLDTYQRRLLHTFTARWNADRARRGQPAVTANDALTQGLEALIAMVTEGANAL
jgi:hypothetical protein